MMNLNSAMRGVAAGVRRHPGRTTAICVPLVAASIFTGTQMASAQPEATLAIPSAARHAAAAPHVMNFADHLTGRTVRQVQRFAVPLREGWHSDGCDHDYGTDNVCVPWHIPGPASQRCSWLRSMGIGPVKVYGKNRQHLPENAQGYVCASGT